MSMVSCLNAVICLSLGFFSIVSSANPEIYRQMKVTLMQSSEFDRIRVGVYPAKGAPVGDVLYIHGFADSFLNHGPLFKEWSDKGLRVISFDLPDHGISKGGDNNLNLTFAKHFSKLSRLVNEVEQFTHEGNRPFILAGWSTGGLLAVRMVQTTLTENIETLKRPIYGMILFAPGIAVQYLPGTFGFVTEKTLLSRPPSAAQIERITPMSPFTVPLFAGSIVANSWLAYYQDLPKNLPILMFTAGDDQYVKTNYLHTWLNRQRNDGVSIAGIHCASSKHELDNEPHPIGNRVRESASEFATHATSQTGLTAEQISATLPALEKCASF